MRRPAPLVLALAALLVLGAQPTTYTICHKPGPLEDPFGKNQRTMQVQGEKALAAHLAHGDTLGPCGGPTPTPTMRVTPHPTPRPTVRPTPRPTVRPTPSPTPKSSLGPPRPSTGPTSTPSNPSPMPTTPPTDT